MFDERESISNIKSMILYDSSTHAVENYDME